MAQCFPDARLSDSLTNERGVTGLRAGTLPIKLTQQPVRLQPSGRQLLSEHRPVAAPRPIFGVADHPRADRIQHDVPRSFQQVGAPFDQHGLEATLEEVARESMPMILDPVFEPRRAVE